jgi:hypothetical protein
MISFDRTQGEGRLLFATAVHEPVRTADAVFIAVGTPSRRGDGHADIGIAISALALVGAGLVQSFASIQRQVRLTPRFLVRLHRFPVKGAPSGAAPRLRLHRA